MLKFAKDGEADYEDGDGDWTVESGIFFSLEPSSMLMCLSLLVYGPFLVSHDLWMLAPWWILGICFVVVVVMPIAVFPAIFWMIPGCSW